MRSVHIIVAACVVVALYLIFVWPTQRLFRSFDNLERNAKQVITATELQGWAAKFLTQHPVPPGECLMLRRSELETLETPLPKSLLGLYHNPPSVSVYETTTNSPGYVMLMWGGGVIGHCGFEIGPTNFVSYRSHTRAWQPGVYFWSEFPLK